jgi:phosphoenolpyruvate carboxylase
MSPEELEVSRTRLAAGVPPGLTGDAATQWSKDKLVELLPRAVAQLQKDLDFGTEKVKSEAADKILKANGMDKREAAAEVSRPAIILNLNMGDSKVPWLQRIQPKGDK